MKTILLDMDDTLADFSLVFEKKYKETLTEVPKIVTGHKPFYFDFPHSYVDNKEYRNHPVLPNARKLVLELLKFEMPLIICTSCGSYYHSNSEIEKQKKEWLEEHFPELNKFPIIFTTSGIDKALFAHKNSFLIDDHPENVELFIKNGGSGIIYNDNSYMVAIFKVYDWLHNES